MSDLLLQCDNVGKKFCRSLKTSLWYGVKDSLRDLTGRGADNGTGEQTLRPGEFWANQNISFEVRRGQCLALIGRNGAGKTTLLKMINGLIKPDCGSITIRGTVSGLIALGAGFDPVLTGRENILVNGSILGLSRRQINDRIEKIVDFAELSDAIDSPVRNYSSGMQVRLGFSAAVNLIQPDVLLLDEVLAVGDIGFTIKCLNAMRELTNRCAVLFVTHSMQFVTTFCTHALLLNKGRIDQFSDDLGFIIDQYHKGFSLVENSSGTGDAVIHNISMSVRGSAEHGVSHLAVPHGKEVEMELDVESARPATLRVYLMSQSLVPLVGSQIVGSDGHFVVIPPGRHKLKFSLGQIDFNAGLYPLVIALGDVETGVTLARLEATASIRVQKDGVDWGFISRKFHVVASESADLVSVNA